MAERRQPPRQAVTNPDDWPNASTDDPLVARAQRLALNLRTVMDDQGLTVRTVADRSGVSVGTVNNVLHGQTWPDILAVMRLEQGLCVDLWAPANWGAHLPD